MPALDDMLPRLLPDVVIRPLDEPGCHVVKNPRKRTYLKLGEQETFLLQQLDGSPTPEAVAASFEQRFHEPLSVEDLRDFLAMAEKEGLVGSVADGERLHGEDSGTNPTGLARRCWQAARSQHPLFFRITLFNPNRTLNWLEPKTRWIFSRQVAVLAGFGTVFALALVWANRHELVSQFSSRLGWEAVALVWFTTILVTICHEFGHGLACKRYGGEVHEMGALWIFFTPCLFCNVSDAWLLARRWPRLLISMAGTYVDLLIWIVAVVVWRVTARDTAINYMSWIIVTTCGLRVFFNINPLMRLDGYYALADLLEVHNLRRRSREHWLGYIRWVLWGAKRPAPSPDGRALLWYGGISWSFKLTVLYAIFLHLASWLGALLGPAGMIGGAGVFVTIAKKYFKGSLGGEFTEMFQKRRRLALLWISLAVAVFFMPIYDRSGGPFRVRPVVRWELRAPVAGFLREVAADEGDHVGADTVLARLEVPELASQITRKDAEIHECEANLRRLEAGPRREELAEQRERVKRAETWRDLARRDLERTRQALAEELAGFELRVEQARSEREYLNTFVQQAEQLYRQGGLAGQQLLSERKRLQVAEAAMQQAEAGKRAREAEGTLVFEGELARREKELADTRAALALLEAGTRSEDIEAERARLQRLREEANHLHAQQRLESVTTPVAGTITTPRLREKVGQFLEKGAVICLVENLEDLEAEIAVSEQDASYVVPGQTVRLKPRSLPFSKLLAKVDRIAPSAAGAEKASEAEKAAQNTVTVYCHLVNADGSLRTGMTGFGRIYHRLRPLGFIVLNRALRLFRTEFWW